MANLLYAPEFKVVINNLPIPSELRASISSVTFQSSLDAADRVELTLVNENLRWLDHPLLVMDKSLVLSMGYAPDPLTQLFAGEIVSQNASFPASGTPTLTVAAQDRRLRLQRGRKARWFAIPVGSYGNRPIPDVGVLGMVSLEHGLLPVTDPIGAALAVLLGGAATYAAWDDAEETQKIIRKQASESDFDFLRRIAAENGWEMMIDHSGEFSGYKLRFMSPLDHLSPDVTLRYGQSLIDFSPRLSNVGQIAGISATIWLSSIKTEFTINVSYNWDRQELELGITSGFGLPGSMSQTPEALAASREKDQGSGTSPPKKEKSLEESSPESSWTLVDEQLTLATAPRVILGKLIPLLNKRLTGSGSTVGNPRMIPGKVLRLEGLGEKFSGLYRVTSATHTIDSGGYRSSFEVCKEIWFGSIPLHEQGAVPIRVSS
ncbi:MAG: hypothetical protein WC600_08685 [Desulfobaccales bacterium]